MVIFQPDRYLLAQFVSMHASKMQGTVLDVGGGTRRYAGLFAHCDYRILDVDEESHPDIVASTENIPLEDASVDGIVCTQVLGDVWNVKAAVTEMVRVLKPGGLLLITESFFNEQHGEPQDFWRFTEFTYKKLLEDTCDIVELQPRGGYFASRAQNAIRYQIEKWDLYRRPLLGRIAHVWATLLGKWALFRDRHSDQSLARKFPIGHCILAKKKD